VIDRIDRILELLPQAEKQAHERIIGERQVANADKVVAFMRPTLKSSSVERRAPKWSLATHCGWLKRPRD
jgi:hypothetical protein